MGSEETECSLTSSSSPAWSWWPSLCAAQQPLALRGATRLSVYSQLSISPTLCVSPQRLGGMEPATLVLSALIKGGAPAGPAPAASASAASLRNHVEGGA